MVYLLRIDLINELFLRIAWWLPSFLSLRYASINHVRKCIIEHQAQQVLRKGSLGYRTISFRRWKMIRIAIPIFHHRVSPVLDTCTRLLIIDFEGQIEVNRQEVAFDIYSPSTRFEILKKLNLNTIICSGISEAFDRMLQSVGIKIICGIAGEVEKIVEAFRCDRVECSTFRMPGYKGR